jgi:signal recognition particle subunit SRP54
METDAAQTALGRAFLEAFAPDIGFERELRRDVGMIDSMTMVERSNPIVIDEYRRNRIAKGAGVRSQNVKLLLRQYEAVVTVIAMSQRDHR